MISAVDLRAGMTFIQDGKLIKIQREGSYHDYATSYEYDEQGRRTKVIEGNLTTYLTTFHYRK